RLNIPTITVNGEVTHNPNKPTRKSQPRLSSSKSSSSVLSVDNTQFSLFQEIVIMVNNIPKKEIPLLIPPRVATKRVPTTNPRINEQKIVKYNCRRYDACVSGTLVPKLVTYGSRKLYNGRMQY